MIVRYETAFNTDDPVGIELYAIRAGGKWKNPQGKTCGLGLYQHHRNLQSMLWPKKKWHRWNELLLKEFCDNMILGILGPASSGKTHEAGLYALCNYYAFPEVTTILCSSTTREMLQLRIWGEIKKYHNLARDRYPHVPGHLLESRFTITTDDGDGEEGREFRNGIIGVACRVGGNFVGLGNYVGVKNERVILIADEGQFMHRSFFDAISNLNKNPWFQLIAMGNPKDRTDTLGIVCEPHSTEGGWDGLPYIEKTRTWRTRLPGGRCVQLVGTDSPNYDYPEGKEPYPFLIGRRTIDLDQQYYGKDSFQYAMMDLGMMPRENANRRVITRTLCEKFSAFELPVWETAPTLKIFALDAAYGVIGGDRCVGGEFHVGTDVAGRKILAMIGQPVLIPVSIRMDGMPEDQISAFVKDYCQKREIPPENVYFDGTGRGSLVSSMARMWSPSINPIEFGGRATDRQARFGDDAKCSDLYGKFVTELWFSWRAVIEAGQFRGLTEEVMMEGCLREWMVMPGGKVDVETKDKTKVRMGRSPDLADMVVCAVEGARRRGFMIQPPGDKKAAEFPRWIKDMAERRRRMMDNKKLAYNLN